MCLCTLGANFIRGLKWVIRPWLPIAIRPPEPTKLFWSSVDGRNNRVPCYTLDARSTCLMLLRYLKVEILLLVHKLRLLLRLRRQQTICELARDDWSHASHPQNSSDQTPSVALLLRGIVLQLRYSARLWRCGLTSSAICGLSFFQNGASTTT